MIGRRVFEQVGLLDEGYFMYFEDADYCRNARKAGFRVVHEPAARIVHLRGKSSPVKEASRLKKRRPSYYYEARGRYFRRGYGPAGLILANLAWTLGVLLVLPRQLVGQKPSTVMEGEFLDNWRGKGPLSEKSS
jgi:GT2 family glycosyltransferase